MAQLRQHEEQLAAMGATLVFVGPGSPESAQRFAAEHTGGHAVLSDAERSSYRAAGFSRSPLRTLHWRMLVNAWRAWRQGHRQGRVQGDPWQQGGALAFSAEGEPCFRQSDRAGGDALDVEALLAALSTP